MIDEIIEIYSFIIKMEDWMINKDGSLNLTENLLLHDKKIKVFVHSNELNSHHRPHVHACYEDREYVISIDRKIEELNNNVDKYYNFIINSTFKKDQNIQIFRKGWNEKTNSLLILKTNSNGQYTGLTEKRPN